MQLIIDNQTVEAQNGMTVLEAARANNIYIPTLCDHKDLSPWGACRMCIVEIDGMRGLPTSCTTRATEGMVVKTQTPVVQQERREIMHLMLASHPSGCLVCEAHGECGNAMDTIRKSSITTGCGSCPSNGQCEFLSVAEYVGATEIKYPRIYRFLPIEDQDSFYDRDYNLCILCGRCVRVCEQIRLPDVLTFNNRGSQTKIGTAYDRSHIEAGCEFCGACVAVCPTGSLSEKFRKWEGVPEETVSSTCTLCGIGCQVELLVKENRVIGSLPGEDELINHGQLCVKGRFAIAEMLDNYRRLSNPYISVGGTPDSLSWDEAIDMAVERLADCPPDKFGMVVSANSTNENLYAAQKFTRMVMGTHHIDTSARLYYGNGINDYLELLKEGVPFSEIQAADMILSLGLDSRYGRSVVGVEIKRALNNNATLFTIHPQPHNLDMISQIWIQPQENEWAQVLENLLLAIEKPTTSPAGLPPTDEKIQQVAEQIRQASHPIILIGSDIIHHPDRQAMLYSIRKMAQASKAGIVPLPAQSNLVGSLMMGTYPEVLPGGRQSVDEEAIQQLEEKWNTCLQDMPAPIWDSSFPDGQTLDVLYIIGDVPLSSIPASKFTIFQNIFPPTKQHPVDLVLPSTAFTEENGTITNGEGRIQPVTKVVNPPGQALPDWQILGKIAQKMEYRGFAYNTLEEIQTEIAAVVDAYPMPSQMAREPHKVIMDATLKSSSNHKSDWGSSAYENSYLGFPLSLFVKDMGRLLNEKPDFYSKAVPVKIFSRKEEHDHHKEQIIAGTGSFKIVESRMIVPNIHLLRVEAPAVARSIRPGEFVIVRAEEDGERIPLSVSDWDRETGELTFLIMNVGRTSKKLSSLKAGMSIPTVAGPLGNPAEMGIFGNVLLVGGCYGVGSIHPLAKALKELGNKVYIAIEARSAHLFYWEDKLASVADKVFYITRDGSKGFQGHVRSQLPKVIEAIGSPVDRVIANGCNFVLRMTAETTRPYGIKTMVSLNTLMIDGTGMCGVCRVTVAGKTKFACVDGPYFDAHEINWKELDQRRKSYMKEEVITLKTVSLEEETN